MDGLILLMAIGTMLCALIGWWRHADAIQYPHGLEDPAGERRKGARMMLFAPLWPLLLLTGAGRQLGHLMVESTRRRDSGS